MMGGCSMSSQIFVKAEGNGLAMYIGNANGVKIKITKAQFNEIYDDDSEEEEKERAEVKGDA